MQHALYYKYKILFWLSKIIIIIFRSFEICLVQSGEIVFSFSHKQVKRDSNTNSPYKKNQTISLNHKALAVM